MTSVFPLSANVTTASFFLSFASLYLHNPTTPTEQQQILPQNTHGMEHYANNKSKTQKKWRSSNIGQ